MALKLMTANRKKLLLLMVMCILAVSAMGAVNVTSKLVSQPNERHRTMSRIVSITGSLASETPSQKRDAWETLANEQPIAFFKACSRTKSQ